MDRPLYHGLLYSMLLRVEGLRSGFDMPPTVKPCGHTEIHALAMRLASNVMDRKAAPVCMACRNHMSYREKLLLSPFIDPIMVVYMIPCRP